MQGFDLFIAVDWSARSAPSPRNPTKDAIFIARIRRGEPNSEITYHRTRAAAVAYLRDIFDAALKARHRVFCGFDFPLGYPKGFARALTGGDDPFAIWAYLARRIKDQPNNHNNRFAVANHINQRFDGIGPFWGCPAAYQTPHLPAKGRLRHGHGMAELRATERAAKSAQSCWKLFTTGSVGSQALLGLPYLHRFRQDYGPALCVAPFEPADKPIVLAEIYPSLLNVVIRAERTQNEVLDATQTRITARAFANLAVPILHDMLQRGDTEEGHIIGVGHETALIRAAQI
jgi:hypothetical protein